MSQQEQRTHKNRPQRHTASRLAVGLAKEKQTKEKTNIIVAKPLPVTL